ncbi:MAG: hypothetical protein IKC11_02890 [Clostridia bacterium]|nr:hypothetical protein [Clostridia bacterium]
MNIDFSKESACCPYCDLLLFYNESEFFCPDCRKRFSTVTGNELDENNNFIYEEKNEFCE